MKKKTGFGEKNKKKKKKKKKKKTCRWPAQAGGGHAGGRNGLLCGCRGVPGPVAAAIRPLHGVAAQEGWATGPILAVN